VIAALPLVALLTVGPMLLPPTAQAVMTTPAPKAAPRDKAMRAGPAIVPDQICLSILRRAGLTSVNRANPVQFTTEEGQLFAAAMKGHLGDADLGNATAAQTEQVIQVRGALELFGSSPTKQFPRGVLGCLNRYKQ
jgi:hypothetical protein